MVKIKENTDTKYNPEQKNSIRVNQKLIQRAINEGFINELSFYYLLKFTFKNSRIYKNNNPEQRIADLAGVSIQTVKKYIAVLSFRGLLTTDRGAYVLATVPKQFLKCNISFENMPTMAEIKSSLLFKPIEQVGRKQAFKHNLKQFITAEKPGERKNYYNSINTDTFAPGLSVRFIAKLLKISEHTTIVLVKEWNRLGIIKTEMTAPVYHCKAITDIQLLEGFPGYKYNQNGGLYNVAPARHQLLQHPIKLKPITAQRYRAIIKDEKNRAFIKKLNQYSLNRQLYDN